jgi:hypothetical protein
MIRGHLRITGWRDFSPIQDSFDQLSLRGRINGIEWSDDRRACLITRQEINAE